MNLKKTSGAKCQLFQYRASLLLTAKAPTVEADLIRAGKEVSGLCPVLLCQTQLAGQLWGSGPLPSELIPRVVSQRGFLLPRVHPTAQFPEVGEVRANPEVGEVRANGTNVQNSLWDQLYLRRFLSEMPLSSSSCRPPLPSLLSPPSIPSSRPPPSLPPPLPIPSPARRHRPLLRLSSP